MLVIRDAEKIKEEIKTPVVTLGNFDGIHLGHKTILNYVSNMADKRDGTAVAITFSPHPLKVLSPDLSPPMLTTFKKKVTLIQDEGIDILICARFSKKFADQHPRSFAANVLAGKIGAKEVVVGYDYRFGKGREGTIDYLKKMGEEFDFTVTVIDAYKVGGEIVSSTAIRSFVEDGEVGKAAGMLGRYYSVEGRVVNGMKQGVAIGYPTANISTPSELLPRTGVYAARVKIDNRIYNGVVNIGFNPTFKRDRLTIEMHILEFKGDLYGRRIEIEFIGRIRNEQEFPSAGELAKQIKRDVAAAGKIMEEAE